MGFACSGLKTSRAAAAVSTHAGWNDLDKSKTSCAVHLFAIDTSPSTKSYYLNHGPVIKASANKIPNLLRKYNCFDMEKTTPEHLACLYLVLIGLKMCESAGEEFVPAG
jgi:hypothetical protein